MPSNKINLLMVVHCHQPIGNFDGVFKEAYDKSYLPFIEVLERHHKIKMALHYSGCLLDWLKEKRPEFLEMLRRLVKSGQVEMVAGGYYEPILSLIPDRDKFGQLKMHIDFIKEWTGYEAKGAWLSERVWEPYLARIFAQAGLLYTVVDDSHFELAGKKVDEILGYYLTEEEGFKLALFPSSKKLRYNMPFKLPCETIDYLRSVATPDGTRAVTFGDDGEKFGLWPQTYKWVYEEGWLENFLRAIEENLDWIRVMTPSEYIKTYEPLGRLYIPCASYPEMLEWSGGYFRNFLVKYPEANWMHKRMLYASQNLEKVKGSAFAKASADRQKLKVKGAMEALYRAQCNCAYWHGVFGGLYLHHLRAAVYKNIIDAENILKGLGDEKKPLKIELLDIDKDGADEVVLENDSLAVFVDPMEGGSILEIDYRPKSINLLNTLTRRPETYHKKIRKLENVTNPVQAASENSVSSIHDVLVAKEKDLNEFLNYDWYRKSFMLEHFLPPDADLVSFSNASFRELGDFVANPYKCDIKKEQSAISLLFEREGVVESEAERTILKVDKSLKIGSRKAALDINYRLKNMSDKNVSLWFGAEFNLSLKDSRFTKRGELLNIKRVELEDEWFKLFVEYALNKNADLWFYHVETVSGSESGFEKTYQQICLLFHWKLFLEPRQAWSVDMSMVVR